MSDTITVTVQKGNGAASDFNSGEEAAPLPPTGAGNTELDTGGSASLPPVVNEDDASTDELSDSEVPSPPGFDENASDSEEGNDDDSSVPTPPEVARFKEPDA